LKQSQYSDTSFSVGTLQAARRAAGAVAHAVDCILLGRNRNAFCCIRPPGHHAGHRGLLDGSAKSCGFCIFNSVAAGAFHALEVRHCQRVAIIDLDVHHGNGTEDIVRRFPESSRLFFFSLHLYDHDYEHAYEFFPGSGAKDDVVHNIINVPILPLWHDQTKAPSNPSGYPMLSGREGYRAAISQRLLPSLRAFNPSLILLSTGFDAAAGDIGNQRAVVGGNGAMEKGIDLLPEVSFLTFSAHSQYFSLINDWSDRILNGLPVRLCESRIYVVMVA
jgi:acetoin utilization deacetylase AcuC-like enzyme